MKPRISKSQYLKGIQCPKALWLCRHRPELTPEIPESKQFLFDTGHEIGHYAQQFFQNGVEITDYEIEKSIQSTQDAIRNGNRHIFEATACSNDCAYSRIDILRKVRGSNKWDLIEVKGSTKVKDYHIHDMSLQRYAFVGAGYNIRKSILMHINREYVKEGDLNLKELFTLEDTTRIVKKQMESVADKLNVLFKVLRKRKEPEIEIGDHCSSPFECDYVDYCWNHIPDYSVYNIFSGRKLEDLISNNVIDPANVPSGFDLTDRQKIEIRSYKSGRTYFDKERLREFLDTLRYPLFYLDYETISPGIPLFDNSSPYQQIPFQFSLHVQRKKGGSVKHVEFLHTDLTDPRPEFIKALVKGCKKRGSVVVYNRSFESRINNELGKTYPEYKKQLDKITGRMVDLLIPFRSRFLYHPKMKGSASLKSVLPAFVKDVGFDDLEIQDGRTASHMYLKYLKGMIGKDQKEGIFQNLRDYCKLDTLAEVRLMNVLYKKV